MHSHFDVPSGGTTLMTAMFGQFLDHDLTLTPEGEIEEHGECCTQEALRGDFEEPCFPIVLPRSDTFFRDVSQTEVSGIGIWYLQCVPDISSTDKVIPVLGSGWNDRKTRSCISNPCYLLILNPSHQNVGSSREDEDVDEVYQENTCTTLLELTRSEAWCEGNSRVRHQFNGITAFVDGSGVYGSDDETAHMLRGTQGKMLTFDGKLPASTEQKYQRGFS